jgi:hypothetical protein
VDQEPTPPTTTITLDEAVIAFLRMGKGVKGKAHELACISEDLLCHSVETASLNSRLVEPT